MVVIVDYDEEDIDPFCVHDAPQLLNAKAPANQFADGDSLCKPAARLLFQNVVTEAFAQYPIIESIVKHIDLNTLDSLARCSYLIHDGLVQYRSSLLGATLHCVNSDAPVDLEATFRFRARAGNHYFDLDTRSLRSQHSYLPYNGKSGECARDLVAECRKCGVAVCRNCTIKQPPNNAMKDRHRRLCMACVEAPLAALLSPALDPDTPFQSHEVQRELCQCDQRAGVWLCQPCGRGIRASDSDYLRIWRWRSQYGEVLGGLGTGIGDGDRGVICGREADCFAAKEREQETDCDAEDARETLTPGLSGGLTPSSESPATPFHRRSSSNVTLGDNRTPSPMQLGPGYERHEIVGIGGVVKRKLLRMVRVGACVPVWDDERCTSDILCKERQHQVRSICGWCCRIIPGSQDRQAA